jgi:hypothetical protein
MQLICRDPDTGLFEGRVSVPTQARLPQQLRQSVSQQEQQWPTWPLNRREYICLEIAWSSMSCGYLLARLWENAWA